VPETHSTIAKQHVDLYRKTLSRKRLLRWATDGPAYIPFCGDGDLAAELYSSRRLYAADIDDERTAVFESRFPAADVRVADCDFWVFRGLKDPLAIGDFDAYANPYKGFNDFWAKAPKGDRLVLFFTDGQGMNIEFKGRWHTPDGQEHTAPGYIANVSAGDVSVRRATYQFWFNKTVMPWFRELLGPEWRILEVQRYTRAVMLYWGAAIDRFET